MWIDSEIIKPEVGKKYSCMIHSYMEPKGIVRGYISCWSNTFFCDIYSNGLYSTKSYIDFYAYEM